MEDQVIDRASQLLSNDPRTLQQAHVALESTKANNPIGHTFFPRLVQELAVYQQGAVVKKLMSQALGQSSPTRAETSESVNDAFRRSTIAESGTELAQASLFALVSLSSSKAFALFCQDNLGVSEELLCFFLENLKAARASTAVEDLFNTADYGADRGHLAAACLDGLIYHARASEKFRQHIRGHARVLPAVLSLFEDDTIKQMSNEVLVSVRQGVTSLVLALALPKDSQEWMIEQGYLRLLGSICGSGIRRRFDDGDKCPGGCLFVILRLVENSALVRKMREARVLSIFDPYSRSVDSALPGVWQVVKELLDDRCRISRAKVPKPAIWSQAVKRMHDVDVPTVCSWEGCSEGEDQASELLGEIDLEKYLTETRRKKFSRCGRCAAAYYCSSGCGPVRASCRR
ncbi:hypothetical protein KFL_006430080 [Klebsormidium nitens]|uniref:MYND-type domain-containing protein n=1 Tax=Klebsormidium nitens TaxID=105231 RepID=A0A1Y1IMU2_KLENI|nr:hypothetical protein KFL_006430080 [Klebsormidium nitens]|eukprot:GAQ90471.1 hypothetical protein KFL_006430080 [Klebsormidium nitens]